MNSALQRQVANDQPPNKSTKNGVNGVTSQDISNQMELDARNPIPIEPGFTYTNDSHGNRYIPFLDQKDNFFSILAESRFLSVTQNACITTKTNYVIGEGVRVAKADKDNNNKEAESFLEWMKSVNNKRQHLNKVCRKVIDGYQTFGNAIIEVVRLTIGNTKYLYLYPKSMLDCRLAWPNKNGEVTHVLISRYFRKVSEGLAMFDVEDTAVKKIPIYKPGSRDDSQYWLKEKGGKERTVIFLANEVSAFDHYGVPSSISSITDQQLEYSTKRFNMDQIYNNMVPGGTLFLAAPLTNEEANSVARRMIKQHTGHGNRGRILVISSEKGLSDVDKSYFVPYEGKNKEGQYQDLGKNCRDNIILSNEWDAVLAGLADSNSLGKGAGYLSELYFQKEQTVVKPLQNVLLDEFLYPVREIADRTFNTNWSKLKIDIQPKQIVNAKSDLMNSKDGLETFLKIVDYVASGKYSYEAAVKLVVSRFGLTEEEAKEQLGTITVTTQEQNASNQQAKKINAN